MIITQTSLRLSLLGGNTDFKEYYLNYGGMVVSTTIDKYVYCIVKKRFDDLIIVNYTQKETVKRVDDIKHELVREAMKMVGIKKGIEISFLADIPSEGTGLASSSAVTIGVLNALYAYRGMSKSPEEIANRAIEIELNTLKKPIGIQDQHAIASGGLRRIEFTAGNEIVANRIQMNESVKEDFNNSLMLFYTDITRRSDDILESIDIKSKKNLLDQNKQLALDGANYLLKGDLRGFGGLLNFYWHLKKQFSDKISTPEIDEMYKKAIEAGAYGGKIVGAGGGGFLLVMFPAHKRAKIREALKDYKELPFRFSDSGSKVVYQQ